MWLGIVERKRVWLQERWRIIFQRLSEIEEAK